MIFSGEARQGLGGNFAISEWCTRAKSRDFEALQLDERSEAAAKYMLSLESRELRKQAQALRAKRIDMLIHELEHQIHARASIQFAASPTSG